MHGFLAVTLAVLIAAPGAAPLGAQDAPAPRPVAVGLNVAGLLPTGELAERSGAGFAVTAIVRTPERLLPPRVSWRAELGYAVLGGETVRGAEGGTGATADTRLLSALFSVELTNRRGLAARGFRPYALAGVGVYRFEHGGTGGDPTATVVVEARDATNFGLNAGLGLAFPLGGLSAFVEARFHNLFDDDGRYVAPLSVGLTF